MKESNFKIINNTNFDKKQSDNNKNTLIYKNADLYIFSFNTYDIKNKKVIGVEKNGLVPLLRVENSNYLLYITKIKGDIRARFFIKSDYLLIIDENYNIESNNQIELTNELLKLFSKCTKLNNNIDEFNMINNDLRVPKTQNKQPKSLFKRTILKLLYKSKLID